MRRSRRASAVLACGATIATLAGGLLSYTGHVLSNSEQFATRATSALGDPGMRAVIARRVTAALVESKPDLLAVQPLIGKGVELILGSGPFQSVFEGAAYDLHRTVFTRGADTFSLRLVDVGVLVDAALRTYAPSLRAKVPQTASTTLARVSGGDLGVLTDVAQAANRARDLGKWLLLGGLLMLAGSVAVAIDGWLGVRRIGFAVAAVGLLVVAAYLVARPLVIARFPADGARDAAGSVWDAFMSDLFVWALLVAGAGVLLATCATVITQPAGGSLPSAVRRIGSESAEVSGASVASACGLIVCGVVFVVAPETGLRVILVLGGAALTFAGLLRLFRLALTLQAPQIGKLRRPRPPSASAAIRSRPARVAVLAVGLAAAAVAVAVSTHEEPAVAHPIVSCNRDAKLCDRPLDRVVFAATHNSMGSSTETGWLFPSQDGGIGQQLAAGVRGLLIDTHYGISTPRGVLTVFTPQTSKLARVVDTVGPKFIAAADRLRARIGFQAHGERSVYLCHAFCEVGATPARDAFAVVRDFVMMHPDQVIVLSIEDDVTPTDTERLFRDSGMLDLVYQGPSGPPWPTLRQLIEQDRRVLVLGENDTGGIAWYRSQFGVMEETPYRFTSVQQLTAASSCRANRGGTGKSLFLLNHWVDTSPAPKPSNASTVNAYQTLLGRARRCQEERHHVPNLVAVDFYKRGDLLRVVATLNGV